MPLGRPLPVPARVGLGAGGRRPSCGEVKVRAAVKRSAGGSGERVRGGGVVWWPCSGRLLRALLRAVVVCGATGTGQERGL